MLGPLSKFFHKQTNPKFKPGTKPPDSSFWPKEWKEIIYKSYPRFPKINLTENLLDLGDLKEILFKRKSERNFDKEKFLTFEEFSTLLYYSAGIKDKKTDDPNLWRRFYPSGGARYPLEVYLTIQRVESLEPGVYHYNVKDNLIEKILGESGAEEIKNALLYPWSKDFAFLFMISSCWDRNFIKYRDFGYRLVLLEAGHLMQNLALIACALDIKICPLAGFNPDLMNEILDIKNEGEDLIYIAALGK